MAVLYSGEQGPIDPPVQSSVISACRLFGLPYPLKLLVLFVLYNWCLCLAESALDDLDLNEFGVAALEKTFDSSSVPHTSGIMIGT